ncbi:nuclear matrix constituent protein 1-like [Actinidia eriantha]|uniref:nuclear matrix constituent protein 1-like n=1 Tax=Actinidia eriantha TaxID=165200 RepID=UPI00258D507E|nr:nuclear matrix constituent protein 1-like [Actinidia eriantha]
MFTPQRKVWSGWPLTPRSEKNGSGSGSGSDPNSNPRNGDIVAKSKSVAFVESTPLQTIGENGETMDRNSMAEKISKLENELFDYQYNMGILLIEKKEWTSQYEELKQSLEEVNTTLKREHAAHMIALTQIEKREENLRKALGVEKQCVFDLEKALREMRSEHATIKFTADSKLAEANALITSIEEKSLEVEAKLHAADAKLAEVSRKSSEIERKLHEVEARENAIRRERLSFNAEREAQESTLSKHREDLRDWERKLKEEEERLAEVRRLLNQREERANENDLIFKQKQNDHEEAHKKIEISNSALKKKEDDISRRLANLAVKEKESDALKISLVEKEKELCALEEKLDARERVEIQKLLDEHKSNLDAKEHKFDMEMEQKRKAFDEDLKSKAVEVEKKEAEINHLEEKVAKRELAYEKKLEKFKEKEKDLESRSKDLKEREKAIKVDEKKMGNERKQILVEKERMCSLKVELEDIRAIIEEQRLKVNDERERLRVTAEERSEHERLQAELKLEIDKGRQQRELLLKEGEELKQEREKFEKEWEELDEKRVGIKKELEEVTEQKEKLEKLKRFEEERLDSEKRATQDYVQRELEALKLAQDSFAASVEHEKAMMGEKIQSEKSQMFNDFELQKRELETDIRKRQEEMENNLGEREKLFVEERDRELSNINYLREVAQREMEEMKVERLRIEKEKEDTAANQKHLEGQQLDMRKDIDDLVGLSRKLKDQREQFLQERERFIEFVEKHKSCQTCGEITSEFLVSDLQSLPGMDNVEELPLPRLTDDYMKVGNMVTTEGQKNELSPAAVHAASPVSGGTMSWLRKCTSKILSFSPVKKSEPTGPQNLTGTPTSGERISLNEPIRLFTTEDEPESFGIATNSLDVQMIQSDNSIREVEARQNPSGDDQSNINSKAQEIPEDSQHSDVKSGRVKPSRRGRRRVNRTRTMKAVVAEAKTILGDSACMNEEGQEDSSLVDKGKIKNSRKRNHAHNSQNTVSGQDGGYSEGHSDSATAGSRKRRQKVAQAVQIPGEVRYNLRRHRNPATVAGNGALSGFGKGDERDGDDGRGTRDDVSNSKAVAANSTEVPSENGGSTPFLQFETAAGAEDGNADTSSKPVDNIVLSEEVNGILEDGTREDGNSECRSVSNGEDDEDDSDGDDEESEHPGEVSVGKKLWKFITT